MIDNDGIRYPTSPFEVMGEFLVAVFVVFPLLIRGYMKNLKRKEVTK